MILPFMMFPMMAIGITDVLGVKVYIYIHVYVLSSHHPTSVSPDCTAVCIYIYPFVFYCTATVQVKKT